MKLFQALKTFFLTKALVASQQRWSYMLKTRLLFSTSHELAFFHKLPAIFLLSRTLVYNNLTKLLWIDLDTSKKFSFGAMVFHTKPNAKILTTIWPSRSLITLVLFFFRLLTLAQKNYWLTELEKQSLSRY